MKEIEAKILDIDPEVVEQRLRELGAERIFDDDVTHILFDLPGRKLKRENAQLRLRQAGERVELTYKKRIRRGRTLVRREVETEVSDFAAMRKVLMGVGFNPSHPISKHRTSYRLGRIRYEIDRYPELAPLLEIEGPSEREVVQAAKRLGFAPSRLRHATGAEIMAAAKRTRQKAARGGGN